VAFPESFWITAGAAAPVIALANAVTFGDSMGVPDLVGIVKRSPSSAPPQLERAAQTGGLLLGGAALLSMLNVFAQAFALISALVSLQTSSSFCSLPVIIIIEATGLWVLLPIALLSSGANRIRTQIDEAIRRIEDEARERTAAEQTTEIIARMLYTWENTKTHSGDKRVTRWRAWYR
jgi:hypothetical protein